MRRCLPAPLDDAVRAAAQERYRELIRFAMRRWDFDLIHMHSLDFHTYLPPEGPPVLVTLHLPPDWYPAACIPPGASEYVAALRLGLAVAKLPAELRAAAAHR